MTINSVSSRYDFLGGLEANYLSDNSGVGGVSYSIIIIEEVTLEAYSRE